MRKGVDRSPHQVRQPEHGRPQRHHALLERLERQRRGQDAHGGLGLLLQRLHRRQLPLLRNCQRATIGPCSLDAVKHVALQHLQPNRHRIQRHAHLMEHVSQEGVAALHRGMRLGLQRHHAQELAHIVVLHDGHDRDVRGVQQQERGWITEARHDRHVVGEAHVHVRIQHEEQHHHDVELPCPQVRQPRRNGQQPRRREDAHGHCGGLVRAPELLAELRSVKQNRVADDPHREEHRPVPAAPRPALAPQPIEPPVEHKEQRDEEVRRGPHSDLGPPRLILELVKEHRRHAHHAQHDQRASTTRAALRLPLRLPPGVHVRRRGAQRQPSDRPHACRSRFGKRGRHDRRAHLGGLRARKG
mmetsp:Transcript_1293/g.4080  ORF Transcript_1293/g.4080 Transcript_1293/m.4080 type:complete len:358 (+) Transcript_1293:1203-2276(+)